MAPIEQATFEDRTDNPGPLVYIVLEGGLVQDVISTHKGLDICVIDHDVEDVADEESLAEYRRRCEQLDADTKGRTLFSLPI